MNKVSDGIFITGTDTGVGKTLVAAWLLAVGGFYWKPIQCGLDDRGHGDSEKVALLSPAGKDAIIDPRFVLQAPRSPHEAAAKESVVIGSDDIALPTGRYPLIVEGAGGVLVPLARDWLMIDVMAALRLPVVLVARTGLGTINHTLLSIEALRRRDIPIAGVVLSGARDDANHRSIRTFGKVDILARLPLLDRPFERRDGHVFSGHQKIGRALFQRLFGDRLRGGDV